MTAVPSTDLRLVVFDVDGTLVDSQHEIVASMRAAFNMLGRPAPDRETMLSVVGLSLPQAMAALAPEVTKDELRDLVDRYRASWVSGRTAAPLFPGALAALDALSAHDEVLLAVATGKSRRGLEKLLTAHDLGRRFVSLQVADDHPSKPHPSMLMAALAETGVEAHRAVMVGDTEFDMQMGRAAGLATIGVTWGYHPRERLAGADVLIDDFALLGDALERIWRA
ncbi:HAD family hydrolase [Defluviimonas sp. 20V17]|uniref:Haloacid dehalogenase n=1 Tax=Allgaiera indica TaxID=765699 RepID=A0AAN4UUN1_9RHOB|nr:HAD-IA family hydrolase [Allgaiera indica]KDB04834.1 HAD family hydrolase [Defluviimonas sp. 20V17]GHE05781.1 haloacid dehalogenase [Allgaiera indica]SDX79451.1 phosphoglycolate phosphatase [Allgaiera indica]